MKKKDMKLVSQVLMGGAIISVIMAGAGYLGMDIWLASTQWLLVAAVLALFGLYTRMEG
jgi:membrane-associated PAP2 superfamily phosphatase